MDRLLDLLGVKVRATHPGLAAVRGVVVLSSTTRAAAVLSSTLERTAP